MPNGRRQLVGQKGTESGLGVKVGKGACQHVQSNDLQGLELEEKAKF